MLLRLFPSPDLIAQWKNSELEAHLPRLMDVCAKCLQSASKQSYQYGMGTQIEKKCIEETTVSILRLNNYHNIASSSYT